MYDTTSLPIFANGCYVTSISLEGNRVVSRFLSSRSHSNSRWLFPFYFSNITLRTDLLTFRVTGAVFKIAAEMHRLPACFDNPEAIGWRSITHSLTHSILINLFIKTGLNCFSYPSPAYYGSCPRHFVLYV